MTEMTMTDRQLMDEAAEAMLALQDAVAQGRPCEAEMERVNRATNAMTARIAEAEAVPITRITTFDDEEELA